MDPTTSDAFGRMQARVAALSPRDAPTRISGLKREIERHNYLYHTLDAPEIRDEDFDLLFAELEALEARFPDLASPDSPTRKVGGTVLEALVSEPHETPMLSLDLHYVDASWDDPDIHPHWIHVFNRTLHENREGFLGDEMPEVVRFVAEPKLDGLAIECLFRDGAFVKARTRGDKVVGEVVTHTVGTVRNLPRRLAGPAPGLVVVRGELVLPKADFGPWNDRRVQRGEAPFDNTRNAAAGVVRQLDARAARDAPLRFYAHSLGAWEGEGEPDSEWAVIQAFEAWGFATTGHEQPCEGVREVIDYVRSYRAGRAGFPFDTDGVVVKIDDRTLQRRMPDKEGRSPRWARAFKFHQRPETTVLRAVEFSVGRTGAVTPVAHLDPVRVHGVTVSRATLHNAAQIERLDLRLGDTVEVVRAGDVIPRVARVVPDSLHAMRPPIVFPTRCPSCGAPLVRDVDASTGEADAVARCPDTLSCPAQIRTTLEHWGSRGALAIDGLGERLVDQLVSTGMVVRPSDLYHLDRDALAALDRMGPRSADNLLAAIEASKNAPLGRVLYALGIRHVGEATARDLARAMGSLDRLMAATLDDLAQVKALRGDAASSVADFFARHDVRQEIERLRKAGVRFPDEIVSVPDRTEGTLAGRTFVLTGTLSAPREVFAARIEAAGGRVADSVSKRTSYLVSGDASGSKLQKALDLGVPVLDEAALRALLEGIE
ncbi:MAG: NAD-dependent DNA ligase LigA [Deltaproteobacteria bacterium]|nr:NAD-dependent DNA ligase LigA [Deltaproteobacteria bacterium]